MSARGFLGAGDLYSRIYNPLTGQFDQWAGPFEASKFEIKPNADLKEMTSRGRATYGQVIESVPLPKPADLSVTFSEVNKDSIAMALFGTATALNQGSGTITDEVVTAVLGKWIQLSKGNLATAGLTVKNSAGSTTYVLGTDYNINYRLGMVQAIAGGAILESASLKVTATYNAISGTSISGGTQNQVRAQFKLDGINFADQLPVVVEVWEAVLTPEGAFDFLKNDFGEIALKGRLKTPAGKSEPFKVDLRSA